MSPRFLRFHMYVRSLQRWWRFWLVAAVFGAALLYDAMHGHNIGGWHMPELPGDSP